MNRYIINRGKLKLQKFEVEVIEKIVTTSPDIIQISIGCIEKTFTRQPNGTYSVKEYLNLEPFDID